MHKGTTQITLKGIVIWSIAMLFYFYECFLRVYPNTISDLLIANLGVNAEQYALLGSSFFFIYAMMQLPVGYVIDKLGVRISLTIAAIIGSLGLLWFASADSLSSAIISRLMMGFGASFGYIAVLALALNWFPRQHFGFFTGLSQFLGSIGPIFAGAPFALLLHNMDNNWRLLLLLMGILGIGIAVLIAMLVKNKPPSHSHIIHLERSTNIKQQLYPLLKKVRIWLLILYTSIVYLSMPILGTYFGILFLQARGFPRSKAAFFVSLIWVGYALGSPLIGKWSDATKRRLPSLRLTALLGTFATGILVYFPLHSELLLSATFLAIGVAGSGQSIGVATMTEVVFKNVQTTMLGLTNMCLMLFGAVIPSICGALIHTQTHEATKGVITYTTTDFIRGLSLMPLFFGIAFLIALFGIEETFCRHQHGIVHLKRN